MDTPRRTAQLSQGAPPTLSLLSGDVTIRVLPGDKMYQAMEIEPEFMRPAIVPKKRLPVRLAELARWMPLAAALFGTVKWQPQWFTTTSSRFGTPMLELVGW